MNAWKMDSYVNLVVNDDADAVTPSTQQTLNARRGKQPMFGQILRLYSRITPSLAVFTGNHGTFRLFIHKLQ